MYRKSKPIVLCTGNKNKLKEIVEIFGENFPYKVDNQDIDLPEYQGEPEDIARAKCELAAEHIRGPVLVEDVSLCFNAIGGMPGPYIKWFLGKCGTAGKFLERKSLYKLLDGFEDKTAYAQCIFAYSSGEKESTVKIFDGRCEGIIVPPRGPTNFGWDPIFQPNGYSETFAEMSIDVKNAISHRSNAIQKVKDFLLQGNH
ncbi:inosine triphosphate pyrophosphatase [Biomphalaria pfeifferi]|uniref:Inosine triphosphate pyrophosphatase n=1 Tax=Biomphalaria pfeifferi TaxID=112525 RepID=A0AAD8FLG1_BIOPF|nr:inosine triphosphate pyrophosphatase [Biomphalaria pfeifferi]